MLLNTNYLLISREKIEVFCGLGPHLVKVNITASISPVFIFQFVDTESGTTKWLGREAPVLGFRFQ